jgi:hypothetical protein
MTAIFPHHHLVSYSIIFHEKELGANVEKAFNSLFLNSLKSGIEVSFNEKEEKSAEIPFKSVKPG